MPYILGIMGHRGGTGHLDWGSQEGYKQAITLKLILGQVEGAGIPSKGK